GCDRTARHSAQRGRQLRTGAELLPSEAIEGEQHDLASVRGGVWNPGRRPELSLQQRTHDTIDARASICGHDRVGNRGHGLTVRHGAPLSTRRVDGTLGVVKVSTRGDYASRALLSLALHADTEGPTSVRDIAERTALPQPYLEQI